MLNKIPLIVLCLSVAALCFSCKPNAELPAKVSFRDAVVRQYVHQMDSLSFHDSTSMDYKMLKAYVLNDTAGLKALWEILDLKKSRWDIMWDSCFNVKSIDEIKGEEIYRFSYTASFCRYHTVTTVIKSNDSVSVNTLVWHYEYGNTSMSCELVEQDTVLLDNTQWEKFEASLKVADFWGLKEDNGDTGLDGNTLYVDGCKRGFPKMRTRIHRWSPDEQPIQASFLLLLKYCKTKKGCLTAL